MSNHAVEILAKKLKSEKGIKHTEALREAHYAVQVGACRGVIQNKEIKRWCEEVLFHLEPVVVGDLVAQWRISEAGGGSYSLTKAAICYFSLDLPSRPGDIDETLALVGVSNDPLRDMDPDTREEDREWSVNSETPGHPDFIEEHETYLGTPPEEVRLVNLCIIRGDIKAENINNDVFEDDYEYKGFLVDSVAPKDRAKAIVDGINKRIAEKIAASK